MRFLYCDHRTLTLFTGVQGEGILLQAQNVPYIVVVTHWTPYIMTVMISACRHIMTKIPQRYWGTDNGLGLGTVRVVTRAHWLLWAVTLLGLTAIG